jgi:hypothetical protein
MYESFRAYATTHVGFGRSDKLDFDGKKGLGEQLG